MSYLQNSMIALYLLIYLYVFWCFFILVMGVYRAHLAGRLIGVVRYMAYPLVIVGLILDVLAQYLIATLVFLDLPRPGEYLVTQRLQRYIRGRFGWRRRLASAICDNLLDLFDPTGEHC
jgi:hypothetical protein